MKTKFYTDDNLPLNKPQQLLGVFLKKVVNFIRNFI